MCARAPERPLGAALLATVFFAGLLESAPTCTGCDYEVAVVQPMPCPIFGIPPILSSGLNSFGGVAGYYSQCDDFGLHHAYLWTLESGLVTLPMPPGEFTSEAFDVNDAGQVAGTVDVAGDGLGIVGFVHDGTKLTILSPPAGSFLQPTAIANGGQVVGATADETPHHKAFTWKAGLMTLILPTYGPKSAALDVSEESGDVVGWMGTSGFLDSHAFVWRQGLMADLGVVPDGLTGRALAINNYGRIAIWGRVKQGKGVTVTRSFLWAVGEFTDMGVLPGYDNCFCFDVNDVDQAVGFCTKSSNANDRRPFIWQDGVMTDLNAVVCAPDVAIDLATGINNARQIAAYGGLGVVPAAFVLTPLDPQCLGDLDGDRSVGYADFQGLLEAWGANAGHPADVDGDGFVAIVDFLYLLGHWGPCS